MIEKFRKFREDFELYSQMTDIASVSRRYFVIGFFDGILTILGMIVGAHLVGGVSSKLIISAGFATALALGISSAWGAFEAERIEQKIMIDRKERALLVESRNCAIERAHRAAAYISSTIHGIAPIVAAIPPLIPYLAFPEWVAFKFSLSFGLISLFLIGLFMGKTAKVNLITSGARMLLAGIFTIILVIILNPSHII